MERGDVSHGQDYRFVSVYAYKVGNSAEWTVEVAM